MNRNDASLPRRFFGPVTPSEARDIVARLTGSDDRTERYFNRLEGVLKAFAAGVIDARDMAYQIQCLFEDCALSIAEQEASESCAMDAMRDALDRRAL